MKIKRPTDEFMRQEKCHANKVRGALNNVKLAFRLRVREEPTDKINTVDCIGARATHHYYLFDQIAYQHHSSNDSYSHRGDQLPDCST